jgi:hypothetical protein
MSQDRDTTLQTPCYWQDRAKAARKLAAELCNPAARADMLNVAEAYDRMARRAAERSAGSARESEPN